MSSSTLETLPVVALVGRPNVGKSTLFNRLTESRRAVVHPTPGTTRDRNFGIVEYKNRRFSLVDTGGYDPGNDVPFAAEIREQANIAVQEADVLVLVCEVSQIDNPIDDELAAILRKSGKPMIVAVNKAESPTLVNEAYSMTRLGFDAVVPLSALHGGGILDLLDAMFGYLPKEKVQTPVLPDVTRVAIVGRQNVGKSTMLNRLLGEERVIASPVAGTTRDPIDTYLKRDGKTYCLIDTAGIRRRGKIEKGIEHASVLSAMISLERCDVALLIVDAERGIEAQDLHIGGFVLEAGKPCIIAINKWDRIEKENSTHGDFIKDTRDKFNFLQHALILTVSAMTGQRCSKLWSLIERCATQAAREIRTHQLNKVIHEAYRKVTPPAYRGKVLRINYAVQTGTKPPVFTLFVNDPGLVHFSYRRYLINRLREAFGFEGTPIRLRFREKRREDPAPVAVPMGSSRLAPGNLKQQQDEISDEEALELAAQAAEDAAADGEAFSFDEDDGHDDGTMVVFDGSKSLFASEADSGSEDEEGEDFEHDDDEDEDEYESFADDEADEDDLAQEDGEAPEAGDDETDPDVEIEEVNGQDAASASERFVLPEGVIAVVDADEDVDASAWSEAAIARDRGRDPDAEVIARSRRELGEEDDSPRARRAARAAQKGGGRASKPKPGAKGPKGPGDAKAKVGGAKGLPGVRQKGRNRPGVRSGPGKAHKGQKPTRTQLKIRAKSPRTSGKGKRRG